MAFWGKIFKKEANEEVKKGKQEEKRVEKKLDQEIIAKPGRIITGVIRAPHLTEKSSGLAKENKHVFLVNPKSNKFEIARAIKARYNVGIETVRIINTYGKERRRGKQIGWKPGFKKAVVKIKEGQTIDIQ